VTDSRNITRRKLLAAGVAGAAWLGSSAARSLAAEPHATAPDLEWLPAWRLRELVVRKEVSPVELVDLFLRRIESIDGELGAFVTVDAERARQAARAAESAVMSGADLGPLHGVPVSLKQMVAVEGLALENGEIASRDAIATTRIREAGGIVLGTTCLAGPAAMLGEDRVGAANPWRLSRVAGASSSGSAAGVAAGLCPISIGSDGGGSTRLPAAWCGLVGLHPTVGRVPADHDLMRSLSRTSWSATYGPIARDVRDVATTLSVIAGPHWRHVPSFNGAPPDYLGGLDQGLAGLRLAWTPDFGSARPYFDDGSAAVLDAVRRSAEAFVRLGGSVEATELKLADWYPIFTRITAQLGAGRLYPLLAGAARTRDTILGEPSAPLWTGEIEAALEARQEMAEALLAQFEHHDLLISATSPRIAPLRDEYARWLESDSYPQEYTCLTGHMNLLGFPAITLPAGFVDDMPVGLQLIARPDEDALLLRAAAAFQRVTPLQRRPAL
jgi:aspartyl-tRNA(Asn)/glutamyl-tRNA(Gln) amidotransferase subunit A